KRFANAPGSVPPLLKNASIALATLHWLMLKAQAGAPDPPDPPGPLGTFGTPSVVSAPSAAGGLRFSSVAGWLSGAGKVAGRLVLVGALNVPMRPPAAERIVYARVT